MATARYCALSANFHPSFCFCLANFMTDPKPNVPNSVESNPHSEVTPRLDQLPKIISFESLARCGEEIWIENNGQIYRLRRTKQGKLILTK
ncbi:MAG: hemin uptake protein HemP [Mariniblastus sp.]|jgi:hemin uptake protein HemP